jgi:hypothetical protein
VAITSVTNFTTRRLSSSRNPSMLKKSWTNMLKEQLGTTTKNVVSRMHVQAAVTAAVDPEAPMLLALLEKEIEEAAYQATVDLPITLVKGGSAERFHHRRQQVSEEPTVDSTSS